MIFEIETYSSFSAKIATQPRRVLLEKSGSNATTFLPKVRLEQGRVKLPLHINNGQCFVFFPFQNADLTIKLIWTWISNRQFKFVNCHVAHIPSRHDKGTWRKLVVKLKENEQRELINASLWCFTFLLQFTLKWKKWQLHSLISWEVHIEFKCKFHQNAEI